MLHTLAPLHFVVKTGTSVAAVCLRGVAVPALEFRTRKGIRGERLLGRDPWIRVS